MKHTLKPVAPGRVRLLPSDLERRSGLNRRYMLSLDTENLLQNHYLEAGLWGPPLQPEGIHWGWESPTCQLRGHFLGHWLSAAALIWANTADTEIKGQADYIVAELARCQRENGGEWVGSIPTQYLEWIARGKRVWAPQYTLHKTLMGLLDMATLGRNEQALEILLRWARWYHRWTGQFTRAQLDDILDVETGGMLEIWAQLYGLTGEKEHLELLRRYDRPRIFDALLAGQDPLTGRHANTTIPEVHGAARAWEVTGDERWRAIVEAYWRAAVTERGYFATGGQTYEESWTPPFRLAPYRGDTNQEHCVVYNMMRLAEWLLRWTGDVAYADYWERNLYNGILAQQNPKTGMVAYYLSLAAGAQKQWGTPTDDFWCCHGTVVQAQAMYANSVYYENDRGLAVIQVIPSEASWEWNDVPVTVTLADDAPRAWGRQSGSLAFDLRVVAEQPVEFDLQVRLPWWLSGEATVTVNGERQAVAGTPTSLVSLRRLWKDERVHLELPRQLTTCALPDAPDTVAFMFGPIVLAGLSDEERTLTGDPARPETMLTPDGDSHWRPWHHAYRTVGQERGLRFVSLYEVTDERYTVYFPVRPGGS